MSKTQPYKQLNREEILEQLYKNEDVIISLKQGTVYHFDAQEETAQASKVIQGILIAVDKNFVHLGPSEDELYCSIDINDISVIFKNKEVDESLLTEMINDSGDVH